MYTRYTRTEKPKYWHRKGKYLTPNAPTVQGLNIPPFWSLKMVTKFNNEKNVILLQLSSVVFEVTSVSIVKCQLSSWVFLFPVEGIGRSMTFANR